MCVCVRAQVRGRVPGATGSLDCKSQTGVWEAAEIRPAARGTEVRNHHTLHINYHLDIRLQSPGDAASVSAPREL